MSAVNPMEGVVIPLGTGDPTEVVYEYVCGANDAWTRAETSYISHIRKIAHFVREAERGAAMAGISFRSLFAEGGEHAHHPTFCFDRRKAMMLLAIAKNPALMSDKHVDRLPGDYTTLAKLAQIPAPKLTKLIESGKVSATITRTDVAHIVGVRAKAAKTPLPKVAGGVPIASPGASYAVEIPDEGEKSAKPANLSKSQIAMRVVTTFPPEVVAEACEAANGDDRELALVFVKHAITGYAKRYGWGAAQMDLIEWIEGQA